MSTIAIPSGEQGLVRVFSVSRPVPEIDAALKARTRVALAGDWLGRKVSESGVELFPVSDLSGLGLWHYLREGQAIPEAELAGDRARLDALDGYVLILFSSAFGGVAARLEPDPSLTLIGTYREERAIMSAPPIATESALPQPGGAELAPIATPRGKAGSALVGLALATLVVLAIVWALR